jgi:hypothetical protein
LTAIAMSIFFAALLNSPATGQRILALDDILIGLDMSHRLTVLRILENYFKDWQVLIFTYHKAWFEILKERTASKFWSHPWKSLVVRQEQVRDTKVSLVRHDESGLLLELANRYATRREYKSAAVHARTAMEIILSRFCARKRLPVSYVENRNRQTNHHFLNAIDLWLSRLRSPIRYATWVEIRNELDHSLRFVLHSYSHNSSEREDELEGEVVAAIKIVQQVEGFLMTLRQGELAAEKVSDEQRTFLWLIEDAITTPVSNHHEEALRSLSQATECFLLDELPKRGVIIRLSEDADLWRIFFRDAKLNRSEKILFASMRQYLGGNLKSNKFEVASFNAAVLLLLRMRLLSAAKAWLKLKK